MTTPTFAPENEADSTIAAPTRATFVRENDLAMTPATLAQKNEPVSMIAATTRAMFARENGADLMTAALRRTTRVQERVRWLLTTSIRSTLVLLLQCKSARLLT